MQHQRSAARRTLPHRVS